MRLRASLFVEKGQMYVVADMEHPEASAAYMLDGEVPDGRIFYCHPDDEQRLRDLIAVEQERPKWWRDLQAMKRILKVVSGE